MGAKHQPSSNFVDYVKIFLKSGDGGAGSAHLRREKFAAKGGPDGGDGGRGGHIILKGNHQLYTLLHLKYQKHVVADNGEPGRKKCQTGANGKDVHVEVPLGTVVRNADTGEIECEITRDGEEITLMEGGIGGRGNTHFKSSVNQTPRYAQSGKSGTEAWKTLELKIMADVGLVGFPNAGKSTLLASVSAAKPKIADYPFTTLQPNIGIVDYRDYRSFVMADIPGIIEGAHQGKGLGLRFLRHIERNAILLFIVSCEEENIKGQYDILLNEVTKYDKLLAGKRRILAISKCDILSDEKRQEIESIKLDIPVVQISSVANQGLQSLKDHLWKLIHD